MIRKIYEIIDEMTTNENIENICCNERGYINSWKGVLKRRIRSCIKKDKGETQ